MAEVKWNNLLKRAWEDFYKKKKAIGEDKKLYIKEFAENSNKNLKIITKILQKKAYNFGKWKAKLIKKKDRGARPIIIPWPINDKILLKALSEYLTGELSKVFDSVNSVSFAYQKGKSSRDALLQLKNIHKPGNVLLKIDIKHFFDEIDKTLLLKLLDNYKINDYVKDLVVKSLTPNVDYSDIQKEDLEKFPKEGIPQGNPISAVLSNLYLYELDRLAIDKCWKMVRYADDMVFSVTSEEEAHLVLSEVETYLSKNRNLRIHPLEHNSDSKTAIYVNPKKNKMMYLGVNFDGQKLLPTDDCSSLLMKKINRIIKDSDVSIDKEKLITSVISQWCGYYAFTNISSSYIKRINNQINYKIKKFKLPILEVDINETLSKIRKRQNSKFMRWLSSNKKDFADWLNFYEEEY